MERREYYAKLTEYLSSGEALWQITIVAAEGSSPAQPGMKACIGREEIYWGNLGGGELEHGIIEKVRAEQPEKAQLLSFDLGGKEQGNLGVQQTGMLCGGMATVFVEPLHAPDKLYIIGAGHCGKALAELARKSGWWVTLIDNRPQLLNQARAEGFADRAIDSDYTDIAALVSDPGRAWVVIMTHGHLHDREVLQQSIRLGCRYLGMIGSKAKVEQTFEVLRGQGFGREELDSVHAPIGIPISSHSPVEIAISIMAELIMLRNRRN